MTTRDFDILNGFEPRAYQRPIMEAFITGQKRRGIATWHRRAGKDRVALSLTAILAMQRPGTYWHLLPTHVQARRVVWDAVSRKGNRLIDEVFPKEIVIARNEAEMSLDLRSSHGVSKWWCVGSDNYDRLVGTDPVGVIFSEFALAHPSAWDYIRPILAENKGWALFLSTPRGRNHFYSLWNTVSADAGWFKQMLTVDDTHVVTPEDIEFERRSGMLEDMIQQEFYCSFTAGAVGSYYGALIEQARKEGRITNIPHHPGQKVEAWFDLGLDDATAVWFVQWRGAQPCAIRYREWTNVSLTRIAREIMTWGYEFSAIKWPHDGEQREPTTARTRREIVEDEIRTPIEIVPTRSVADGIAATRLLLGTMAFDARECETGLYALESYSRKWDEQRKTFHQKPLHDWSSHGADALRTGAMSISDTGLVGNDAEETGFDGYALPGHSHRLGRRGRSAYSRAFNQRHKVIRAAALNERIERENKS